MTPKEHDEILDELTLNARHLLENIKALNLPVNPLAYFPEAWPDLFPVNDIRPDGFEKDMQFLLKWRQDGTLIDAWLKILSDKARVSMVAPMSPLRKAHIKHPELSYVVRMIARFFHTHYGKTMPATIERICVIEFPDIEVSKNTIGTILRGFDPAKENDVDLA
jgi:hypothetical protein